MAYEEDFLISLTNERTLLFHGSHLYFHEYINLTYDFI